MRLNDTKLAVLRVFIDAPKTEFYLSQVAGITRLSLDTVHRSLAFWSGNGALDRRTLGRMKLYRLKRCELVRIIGRLMEVEHG